MKRLLMLMSVATMMATAAPAYADPASDNDADFLKQLTAAGVTYQDPAAAIAVAKDGPPLCTRLKKNSRNTIISTILMISEKEATMKGDFATEGE